MTDPSFASSRPFAPAGEARARVSVLRERLEKGGLSAAVVGAGKSGRAAASLLLRRGCQVLVADDDEKIEPVKGARTVRFTAEAIADADLVVLSPGVPRKRPELVAAIERGNLVGEIELASWFVKAPLIGITGTNGKSTTTALTAHLLAAAGKRVFAGGNLGRPLSELAESGEEVDVAVVELSSYQLESIVEASFAVACWLNLTPDHVDRYGDVQEYAAAKRRLLERRSVMGTAVLNAKDRHCSSAGIHLGGRIRWFATEDSDLAGPMGSVLSAPNTALRTVGAETERYDLSAPGLLGEHNKANALAAIECARHFDAPVAAIQAGLDSFRGLPHRLELIRTLGGVAYYNDSKATNVDSSITALAALPGPIFLIAGGKDKGAPWAPLVAAAKGKVKRVLAIGAATPILEAAFAGAVEVERCETLERAITRGHALAKAGEQVLLSPACASFDQFKNYEHRGETFRSLVTALGAK